MNGGTMKKKYHIHDNGGRPFECVIENKHTINIHRQTDCDQKTNKIIYEKNPSLTFHPKKIFVGKSPLNKMTEFSGGHGPKFDGNTILLEMMNNECIFIGNIIWSFDAKEKIDKYISPVGNNDVPYPYAIDKDKNVYLITENVIIKHRDDIAKKMAKYDNPIDYYYDYHLITQDRGLIPPQKPKTDMDIDKWIVGKKEYTLSYRLTKKNKEKMFTINSKGQKKKLTKKDYVDLMKKFGELQSFEPLQKKKLYMDRDIRGSLFGFYLSAVSEAKSK
jgi:hypothetical protein